uniref:BZIP domain-containing protein n=1 Tax=Panagrolaimus davidi TaxID=227884 RepID=A0A914QZP3_9BILA
MNQQTVTPQTKQPRRKGGRRPKDERNDLQVLSEEDRIKRDEKRERNKKAAARSRQKQNDKIEGLKQLFFLKNHVFCVFEDRNCINSDNEKSKNDLFGQNKLFSLKIQLLSTLQTLKVITGDQIYRQEQQQETTQSSIINQSSTTLLPLAENNDEPQQQKKDQQKQQHRSFPQNNIISDYSSSTFLQPSDSIVEPQQQQKQNQEQQQFIPESISNNQFSPTYLPPIAFLRPPKIEGQNPCVAETPPQRPTTLSLFSAFESETPSVSCKY